MIILDTNVLSEPMKAADNAAVAVMARGRAIGSIRNLAEPLLAFRLGQAAHLASTL
jgi:predicted nucleic acid-binding protein